MDVLSFMLVTRDFQAEAGVLSVQRRFIEKSYSCVLGYAIIRRPGSLASSKVSAYLEHYLFTRLLIYRDLYLRSTPSSVDQFGRCYLFRRGLCSEVLDCSELRASGQLLSGQVGSQCSGTSNALPTNNFVFCHYLCYYLCGYSCPTYCTVFVFYCSSGRGGSVITGRIGCYTHNVGHMDAWLDT